MRKLNAVAARALCSSPALSAAKAGRIIVAASGAKERTELRNALECEGHQVAVAETAGQTLKESCSGSHQALILAAQFEGIEPHTLCRRIRLKSDLGIIVLAGDDTTQDRIDAWNAGADDYLSLPFVYRELLARVRAVLRRVTRFREPEIILQDRAIHFESHQIRGPGSRVSRLAPKEFLVLQHLVAHANRAVSHRDIAQTAWQQDQGGKAQHLCFVIRQLRKKLEPDPDHPRYILSERSVGYRFHMPQQVETKWERQKYSG
jgi:two-component system, OmpR family, KDP operon response regulator KdpE